LAGSLVGSGLGVSSSNYGAQQFAQGGQESAQQQGQGSYGYNHGGQAQKVEGNKESFGSKENYNFANNQAYNQGSGFHQGAGAFKHGGHAQGFQQNQQGYTVPAFVIPSAGSAVIPGEPGYQGSVIPGGIPHIGGGVPSIPYIPNYGGSSAASGFNKGANAAGQFQGQGAYSYNQGHSSSTGSGNKETFGNKESFSSESQAGHAIGGAQQSHASGFDKGQHSSGSQVHNQQSAAVPVY